MTAQLAPTPIQKFFDNNGNPLFNGKLYSYVAGTSTPQATYTDSTMGTQNTNPVILNARGEANVWLDTTLSYKLVLQEANGTQIWAVDNIPGNGVFGTVQNIAALRNVTGVGVSNYQAIIVDGYTTAGDGGGGTFWWNSTSTVSDNGGTIIAPTGVSTGRWYRLYSGEVSALWFGVDNTGINDSVSGLNSASSASNGYVFIPSGIYKLGTNPNNGLWKIDAGVTFTGIGTLSGQIIQQYGASNNWTFRLITNYQTTTQLIPVNLECGFYQTASPNSAFQFGQATECWVPSNSSVVWDGQLTATYGSFSDFGSGNVNEIYGGGFEGFNSGSATATVVIGVSGTANNGGVSAGVPSQTPTNNGNATNLRGVTAVTNNSSSGTVTNAAALFVDAPTNTGGGTITNAYGLFTSDIKVGINNYAIYTGAGICRFGGPVYIYANATGLPTSTPGQLWLVSGFAYPSTGRIYCGDGTGYRLEFVNRTSSTDTVVASITDSGTITGTALTSNKNTIGYTTGSGGAVTQSTSKSTAVTLNTSTGTITTNNAALAASATATFNFHNSYLAATSVIALSIQFGSTTGAYVITVDNMQTGVCNLSIHNQSSGSLSEAIVINFVVFSGATS